MTTLGPLSPHHVRGRLELQRVATHVLARARFAAAGRFGLRVNWNGIATPAFGPDIEVVRLGPGLLAHERQRDGLDRTETVTISGQSLASLAALVAVDLDAAFDAGPTAPAVGDPERPIVVEPGTYADVLGWFRLGMLALDRILPFLVEPSIIQLWPEHFDVGLDVATRAGRVNIGASPGDDSYPEPYLYVGPWGADRPGEPEYWNAPFGAVLGHAELVGLDDPVEIAVSFFRRGLGLLG
jgi:hypothetical protein